MAFEIPTSLIREVQITLRKDAGLSSYDPDDPSLPDLPSLDGAIAEFDPSPPYLRCKQCRGRLLRGLQSIVCVYCGTQQRREIPPEPISFKTTFGYHWLLESLDLDGSEAVGLATGENDSTKSHNASNDELVLSDLLNIELNWPAESEKTESSLTSKAPIQSKSSLNLAGVDLDNFFSEAKKETVSSISKEELVPNKQIRNAEIQEFTGQGSLSLFENAQSFDMAGKSVTTAGHVGDPFSGWAAEFQSASSGTLPGDSESFDHFQGSTINSSSPVEASFGPETEMMFKLNRTDNNVKLKNESVPLTSQSNPWNQDNLWLTSSTGVSSKEEKFEMNDETNDGEPKVKLSNPSSIGDNWFQDDLWQKSSATVPKINEEDDSFDAWQDYTSSRNVPDPFSNSWKQTNTTTTHSDEQASEMNFVGLSNDFNEMDFGVPLQPDLFPGASSLRNGSTDLNNMQLEPSISDRVVDVDVKTGGDANRAASVDECPNATIQSEAADPNVEMLMSQMHDLSFMLDSNLSIPKKEDGFDSVL